MSRETSPATVQDVIERLDALCRSLPENDGVCRFAALYRDVTRSVQAELAHATFVKPAFLARLDVVFARLFLDALAAPKPPPAWAPLFEQRTRRGIAPLQFALAGMNAHINRDLPVALVACWQELGVEAGEHADYLRVNDLLARVEAEVKRRYLGGWLSAVDRLLHRADRIDDVVAMWDVRRARDAAWTNGEALWALRGEPELAARFLETLDRSVGFAGRGLLRPADGWFRSLARLVTK
jgi:hypothetical protein